MVSSAEAGVPDTRYPLWILGSASSGQVEPRQVRSWWGRGACALQPPERRARRAVMSRSYGQLSTNTPLRLLIWLVITHTKRSPILAKPEARMGERQRQGWGGEHCDDLHVTYCSVYTVSWAAHSLVLLTSLVRLTSGGSSAATHQAAQIIRPMIHASRTIKLRVEGWKCITRPPGPARSSTGE